MKYSEAIQRICDAAIPLTDSPNDYDELLKNIGDAEIVLLGESTHGTHQFYYNRALITERLIQEKGFHAILIEGDFPDSYRVDRYICGKSTDKAPEALSSFDHFPSWMWQNVAVLECIERLKKINELRQEYQKIHFYGMDLYSLYRSIDAVVSYLDKIDPACAAEARHHYACFAHCNRDPQYYAYGILMQHNKSCEYEVKEQLKHIQERSWSYLEEGKRPLDDIFYIEQNARVIKNAEQYYRSLFTSGVNTWNLRDSHMFETVQELLKHYRNNLDIKNPKIVIWAHNTHIGDASATEMDERGEYNIGQLLKKEYGKKVFSVGFTTYKGTVSAASQWHGPVERKHVRDADEGSYEALFHATEIPNFLLVLKDKSIVPYQALERAIGVIYHPETEFESHYFRAKLADQFDAVIHCDTTSAVEPLDKTPLWISSEAPETYPSGF